MVWTLAVHQEMTDIYVSLDLEMTGVDLETDEIIELEAIVLLTSSSAWSLSHVFRAAAEEAVRKGRYLPESGAAVTDPPTQTHQNASALAPNKVRQHVN